MASEYTDEIIVMALLSGNIDKVEAVIDLKKSILAETGVTTTFLASKAVELMSCFGICVDGALSSPSRGMS